MGSGVAVASISLGTKTIQKVRLGFFLLSSCFLSLPFSIASTLGSLHSR